MRCLIYGGVRDVEKAVFRYIWKSVTPSKVNALFWSLLLDQIATWMNLAYRRVLNEEASVNCAFCCVGK
jgi:hypothetical protein